MSETNEGTRRDTVKITAIIVLGVIVFACIFAFAAISIAFFANPPW
jgi:preprotein translocase subunit SecE